MIPAAFEYARATTVQEASDLLRKFGDEAKVLAGGHSLIPLMRLRFAKPSALVDINPVRELSYIVVEDGNLRVGALTRHVELHQSDVVRQNLPLLAEIAEEVGDNQVRNMGTIGGVMAHAEIVTNKRRFGAKDFFVALWTTPLDPDEIVCEVVFPLASGPHKYIKFRRRLFDWSIVGAGAPKLNGGWRIGLTNCGPTPVRCRTVEEALASGSPPEQAAEHASDGLSPSSDLRASAEYKLHLARVLTKRAIQQAAG